jgi:dolichol-phosphate mannosyltransferase
MSNSDRRENLRDALSIVVPVHFEGDAVVSLHRALADAGVAYRELIFVWDLDEDPTVAFIDSLRTADPRVISLKNAMGRGVLGALKTGISAATGGAILVAMGDLSDDLRIVPQLVDDWADGAWVATPSRWMPGGAMTGGPFLKTFLSKWAGRSLYGLGALPVRDPTNNFKLYDARFLQGETIESRRGFEFALEMTYKAHRRGGRITERPAIGRERDQGESKFKLFKWMPGYLSWYMRAVRDRFFRRKPVPSESPDR